MLNPDPHIIGGFLVVRRVNLFMSSDGRKLRKPPKERQPAVHLTHAEILSNYRGIDGDPWPGDVAASGVHLRDGLAPSDAYEHLLEYYRSISKEFKCDIIYVHPLLNSTDVPPASPARFEFRGYDFGPVPTEFDCYSVLYNEVIYGLYDEMRRYGEMLSTDLLLPSLGDASSLKRTRDQLLRTGADLEDDEPCFPIEVYAPSNESLAFQT